MQFAQEDTCIPPVVCQEDTCVPIVVFTGRHLCPPVAQKDTSLLISVKKPIDLRILDRLEEQEKTKILLFESFIVIHIQL